MDIRHPFRNGTQLDQDDRPGRANPVTLVPRRPRLQPVPNPPDENTGRDVEPVVVDGEVLPETHPDRSEDQDRADTRAGDRPDHKDRSGAPVLGEDRDDEEDEDRPAGPVPVDPPAKRERMDLPSRARAAQDRSPILAPWLRDRQELRFVLGWLGGHVWHMARYHALRIPLYLLRLAGHSPRGMARTLRTLARWLMDSESSPLRREAVDRNLFDEYQHLSKLRRDRMVFRLVIAAPLVLVALVIIGLALSAGLAATVALLVVVVAVFGVIGAPADKPILGRSVVSEKAPRLTADVIVRGLASLGIAEINKAVGPKGTGISFPSPIVRDGPGWRAEVDLPYGVTVDDIMERRKALASGIRRQLGCVWPEPADDEHEGRLVLWVGDRPLNKTDSPPWPLARTGQVDLFAPFVFGTDQRQRAIRMLLMFAGILIGAMPRMGKTFALRVVLLACALDPRVELRLFELKGTGDLSPLEVVAHHYGSGADDETLEACMNSARDLYERLNTRAKTLSRQPRDLAPENKITPVLAARRSLDLYPIVFAVDECQELFSHPTYKDEADRIFSAIVKRGPAMGIIPVLATQRPDAKSLPTGVSANIGIRFCLKVMGQTENDMVLGTSRYKEGVRATTFSLKDKGIGYLVGAEDNPEPQIARSAYLDAEDAERIAARARKIREAAGTLSGHALGELPDTNVPTVSLLDDLLAVVHEGDDTLWSEIACTRLAELRPDTYRGWTAKQLADALKPYGVTTRQVWGTDETGEGRNRRGVVRAQLLDAYKRHHAKPDNDKADDGRGGLATD